MADLLDLGVFPLVALAAAVGAVRAGSATLRAVLGRAAGFVALFAVVRWLITPGHARLDTLLVTATVDASIVLTAFLAATALRSRLDRDGARRGKVLASLAELACFLVAFPAILLSAQVHRVPGGRETPARVNGLAATPLTIIGDGGTELAGVWVDNPAGRGAVLVAHGIGADATQGLKAASALVDAGFHVLVFDHRGHGLSNGAAATLGLRERGDVAAAWQVLLEKTRGKPLPRVLFGISMGGAGVQLAAPGLEGVDAIVLDSTYGDVRHAARGLLPFPAAVSDALSAYADVLAPLVVGRRVLSVRPIEAARREGCPVLILHATGDPLVPFGEAEDLARAYGPRATLVPFELRAHASSYALAPVPYDDALVGLVRRLQRRGE